MTAELWQAPQSGWSWSEAMEVEVGGVQLQDWHGALSLSNSRASATKQGLLPLGEGPPEPGRSQAGCVCEEEPELAGGQ